MSELQTPRAGDDRAPDIGVVALLGRGRPPFVRRAVEGGEQVVRDRLAEEKSAEETLAALDGMDTDDPGFTPRLMELRTGVQGHARAEGRYGFSHIRRSTDANLAAMAGAVRAAEAIAPTRPHPGVESAAANVALGPVAAVMDRTKGTVRQAMGKD
ncbi:hemerythrin domain-containing protein [Streptomyces sp.]|uniref:hemerythrin domain-containing protein n=1 Tax=Streptomyces sp. TaxID=1931 RepID=UPI0028119D50|nr:hemerythrin domain-containing protein [Streptomyces sp.]